MLPKAYLRRSKMNGLFLLLPQEPLEMAQRSSRVQSCSTSGTMLGSIVHSPLSTVSLLCFFFFFFFRFSPREAERGTEEEGSLLAGRSVSHRAVDLTVELSRDSVRDVFPEFLDSSLHFAAFLVEWFVSDDFLGSSGSRGSWLTPLNDGTSLQALLLSLSAAFIPRCIAWTMELSLFSPELRALAVSRQERGRRELLPPAFAPSTRFEVGLTTPAEARVAVTLFAWPGFLPFLCEPLDGLGERTPGGATVTAAWLPALATADG